MQQHRSNEHGFTIDELIERRWRRPKRLEGKPLTFSAAQRQGYLLSIVGRINEELRHDLVTDDKIVRGWSLYEARGYADVDKLHHDLSGMFTFVLLRYEQNRESIERSHNGVSLDVDILYKTMWLVPNDISLDVALSLLTAVALEQESIVESLGTLVQVARFLGITRERFDTLMSKEGYGLMY